MIPKPREREWEHIASDLGLPLGRVWSKEVPWFGTITITQNVYTTRTTTWRVAGIREQGEVSAGADRQVFKILRLSLCALEPGGGMWRRKNKYCNMLRHLSLLLGTWRLSPISLMALPDGELWRRE